MKFFRTGFTLSMKFQPLPDKWNLSYSHLQWMSGATGPAFDITPLTIAEKSML